MKDLETRVDHSQYHPPPTEAESLVTAASNKPEPLNHDEYLGWPHRDTAMEHQLKCWPQFWEAVNSGAKPFEIRLADRPFQVGDTLVLNEYDPEGHGYTGRVTRKVITYITKWFQIAGYVVMGLSDVDEGNQPPSEVRGDPGGIGGQGDDTRDKNHNAAVAVLENERANALSADVLRLRAENERLKRVGQMVGESADRANARIIQLAIRADNAEEHRSSNLKRALDAEAEVLRLRAEIHELEKENEELHARGRTLT